MPRECWRQEPLFCPGLPTKGGGEHGMATGVPGDSDSIFCNPTLSAINTLAPIIYDSSWILSSRKPSSRLLALQHRHRPQVLIVCHSVSYLLIFCLLHQRVRTSKAGANSEAPLIARWCPGQGLSCRLCYNMKEHLLNPCWHKTLS